jgi:hypothetical protein
MLDEHEALLVGLDDVNWAGLEHVGGPAPGPLGTASSKCSSKPPSPNRSTTSL